MGSIALITNNNISVTSDTLTGGVGNAVTGGDSNFTVTGVSATSALGTITVWGNLIPDQDASWSAVSPSQSPSWSEVSPSQSADWTDIAA